MKHKAIFWTISLAARIAWAQADVPLPPDDASQKKIVADVVARALQYSKELPEFACEVVTRRNVDPTGSRQHWKIVETVHEELTFAGNKEDYKTLSSNGKKGGDSRPTAAVSSADFTNLVAWLFDPKNQTEMTWANWDSVRGHRVHAIGVKLKADRSPFTIGKGKNQMRAGLMGLVYADSDTGSILRIAVAATDIPAKYPTQSVALDLQYDFAKIGDHYFLLPFKAETQSKEGKVLTWNEVDFRDYRKPGAPAAAAPKDRQAER
ncbi:MAG TPA: hypothetical protein VKR43_22375 [Bryobacteraceae bacterium]|nr:hypothetical protein [Bryobacteraceae bacterium]